MNAILTYSILAQIPSEYNLKFFRLKLAEGACEPHRLPPFPNRGVSGDLHLYAVDLHALFRPD